jgi:hypothetical protein
MRHGRPAHFPPPHSSAAAFGRQLGSDKVLQLELAIAAGVAVAGALVQWLLYARERRRRQPPPEARGRAVWLPAEEEQQIQAALAASLLQPGQGEGQRRPAAGRAGGLQTPVVDRRSLWN